MDIVLCHTTADFDTLGAAVGLTCLHPGTKIVLTGGTHPKVGEFLAFHRDEYALIEARSVTAETLRRIWVVDTQSRKLLGAAAAWLDQPQVEVYIYDHHLDSPGDIVAQERWLEPVGATCTIIVERLQAEKVSLRATEATVLALGIHGDTGSLTFEQTTARDAAALAWLLEHGANQRAIADFCDPGLSEVLQPLLGQAWDNLHQETHQGHCLGRVLLTTPEYVPGLSRLISHLADLSECDALILGHYYRANATGGHLSLIGRSRVPGVNLATMMQSLGGGGHAQAAAVTLTTSEPERVLEKLYDQLIEQIPQPANAQELMSSPVRTVLPDTTVEQAHRVLLRYGHSGLSVVDRQGQLVGIISRRDLDIALHHGFDHAPVKGYMKSPVRTIGPTTTLPQIQALMVTYDIGRLPVVNDQGHLQGIVTRTDVLRQLYHHQPDNQTATVPHRQFLFQPLQDLLPPPLRQVLEQAAIACSQRGWQLYLVGGAVRDLLLLLDQDKTKDDLGECYHRITREFDLVVDGIQQGVQEGAGVQLARELHGYYPKAEVQIYGQFQTATLHWPSHSPLGDFAVDIATARSEFYPYPAAHPEVAASSIRQDLYRRDFTINALAIRLTQPRCGELLDFFGGWQDLQNQTIRVLHPNSFIEDPTRIFRAVRFAVRLNFHLDTQTQDYIGHALTSGIFERSQRRSQKLPSLQSRLRNECRYLFQLPLGEQETFPGETALGQLNDLGALQCLHRDLPFSPQTRQSLALAWEWWQAYGNSTTAQGVGDWELLLMVLLAPLGDAVAVAEQLHLGETLHHRLDTWRSQSEEFQTLLATEPKISTLTCWLDGLDIPLIILIASQVPAEVGDRLKQYLGQWREQKSPLNGDDLQALGYQRGPQFREMLQALRLATLDGFVGDRDGAKAFLAAHYPQTLS